MIEQGEPIKMSDLFELPYGDLGHNSFVTDNWDQTKAAIHAINQYDNLVEQVNSLKSVITEAKEYLDTNNLTNIASGSILHTKFKESIDTLEEQGYEATSVKN